MNACLIQVARRTSASAVQAITSGRAIVHPVNAWSTRMSSPFAINETEAWGPNGYRSKYTGFMCSTASER